jgi:hypothetical protein
MPNIIDARIQSWVPGWKRLAPHESEDGETSWAGLSGVEDDGASSLSPALRH